MKLVKQRLLHFQAGSSDKVYEVDLVEVGPDRFVVNFRYGRRGKALRDGSKTVLPVPRAEADVLFDKLVESKAKKGYSDQAAVTPVQAAQAVSAPVATAPALPTDDLRHAALLARIQQGRPKSGWSMQRIIYRTGELKVPGASGAIALQLRNAGEMQVHCIAWALTRLAEPAGIGALSAIAGNSKLRLSTRRLAELGLLRTLSGQALVDLQNRLAGEVPTAEVYDEEAAKALTVRWMLGLDRDEVLENLRTKPFATGWWRTFRHIYKMAECIGDDEVWGTLARRMDIQRAGFTTSRWSRYVWMDGRSIETKSELKSENSRLAFSTGTRKWFRRHTWWTLNRLGRDGQGAEYCQMAAGLLLAYTDEDAGDARTVTQRSYYGGSTTRHYPLFSNAWAMQKVLHGRSTRLQAKGSSLLFSCNGWKPGDAIPDVPEAPFPKHWDDNLDQVVRLLANSRCGQVHRFAARVLRANPGGWGQVSPALLRQMFGAAYEGTVTLAADIAVSRYDAKNPDFELVLAVLSCAHEPARDTAAGWVRANPTRFLSRPDFVVALALAELGATRRLALELLGGVALASDVAREVVDAIVAAALATTDEGDTERLRDAAAILLTAFSEELKSLSLQTVSALVHHAIEGVAELGAKVLLGHRTRPAELPDDLLADIMTSPFAVVRGIGVRLYGELPDAVLSERYMVLVHLCANRHADVRSAARPIVQRLAENEGFGRQLMASLLDLLSGPLDEGVPEDLVKLIRDHLPRHLATTAQVLQLVTAPATVTQELGGVLLRENVDPASLTVAQAVGLGRSDILAVRRACWHILEARVDAAKQTPAEVFPLLDAAWEDSREFARRYISQHFGAEELPVELLLALCDSAREEVQAFGREMMTRFFVDDRATELLLKLSQHPSASMQLFASTSLHHADTDVDALRLLERYFRGVLGRVNTGSIAKKRVHAFLRSQAVQSAEAAEVVAAVLIDTSATCSVQDRAASIETLVAIAGRWPDVDVRLKVRA